MKFEAQAHRRSSGAGAAARRDAAPAAGDLPRVHPGRAGEVDDAVRRPSALPARAARAPLAAAAPPTRAQLSPGLSRVEIEAGCDRIASADPGRFQDEAQAALRKRSLLARWRQEVDAVLPGDRAGARRPAPSRRRAAAAHRPDLRRRHRRAGRAAVEPLPRRAACAIPLPLDGATDPDAFLRGALRRATRRAPPGHAVRPASAAPPTRRRSTRGSSNRTRRCTRLQRAGRAAVASRRAGRRDLDRPELRPPPRLSRRR